jgi:thioredoxin-related protein
MKKLIVLALFVGQSLWVSAQGIVFEEGSFAEIKQRAAMANKLIFIDAFTVWCGPCKQLSKNIFPLPTIGEYFNKNFVNVKIDMEKGEGIELAKTYSVNAYPTLLFLNAKGELVHRTCGLMPEESLLSEAKNAVLGENTFVEAQKNKDKIVGNSDEALKYFQMMDNACARFDKEVELFFSSFDVKQLALESTDKIFSDYVISTNSKGFEYVTTHTEVFTNRWGLEKYNAFLKSRLLNDIDMLNAKNKTQVTSLESKINKYASPEDKEALMLQLKIKATESDQKVDAYAMAVITYVNKYAQNDPGQLNNYAWSFYEKIDNVKYLGEAEKWAELACSLQKNDWHNIDTYAAVLYKLKKKEQATIEAQKAISMGKRMGEDVSETESLLKKISEMK